MSLMTKLAEPYVIEARGLTRRFGAKAALNELDLAVPTGAVYLLTGNNGSGKSTLLRSLLDLSRPEAGVLKVFGKCPVKDGAAVRSAIGYLNEQATLPYENMTVQEFLGFCQSYYHNWDEEYARELGREFELEMALKCGALSKGGARRVQIVAVLAHRPELLLLDEPADGLDPVARDSFYRLLATHLADSPTTVLMSSHLVQESDLLCDHVGVIVDGRMRVQLARTALDEKLKRYVIELDPVSELGRLGLEIIEQRTAGTEVSCLVWGDENEILGVINGAGGKARIAHPVSLAEATRALINQAGRVA